MNLNGFIEWLEKQGRPENLTRPRVRREHRGKWAVTLPGFEKVHPYTFDRWVDALAFANKHSSDDPGDRYALVQQGVRQSFEPIIYYWSSNSGGTRRAAEKLATPTRPIGEVTEVQRPFILISPTYDQPRGGFTPKPVQEFLDKHSAYMVGVIGAGNRSFGDKFCMGAHEIAKRYNVPVLYRIEIMGLQQDYEAIDSGIQQHWHTLVSMRLS